MTAAGKNLDINLIVRNQDLLKLIRTSLYDRYCDRHNKTKRIITVHILLPISDFRVEMSTRRTILCLEAANYSDSLYDEYLKIAFLQWINEF